MMTHQDRLSKAHADAAALYLKRQAIQSQVQQWQAQAAEADRALLRSDGQIELLETLIAAEKSPVEKAPDGQ